VTEDKELENLIKLVSNITDAHTSALFWLNKEQNQLQLKTVYSLSRHLQPQASIELGSGLLGWVAKNAKPVNVGKFIHDSRTLQYYTAEENIKSFVAVPVMDNGRLVGVLSADSKRNYLFNDKHQKILDDFGRQFCQLIERQKRLGEISEQVEGYNKLYQQCNRIAASSWQNVFATIMEASHGIANFDHCLLALLNSTQDKLEIKLAHGTEGSSYLNKCFPAGHGLAGLIIKQKKPLLLNGINQRDRKWFVFGQQGPKWEMSSFLGFPLVYAGKIIGIIAYTSNNPTAFDKQEKQLMSIMALQIAAATSQWQMYQVKEIREQLDSVTGLLNHSFFQRQLKQKLLAATLQHPLSLMLIKINSFGQINWEYGHETGDEILRRVACILLEVVPDRESVSRFGGGKFALSLEDKKPDEAKEIGLRICRIIEHSHFIRGKELGITVSIGLVSCPGEALDWVQLMEYCQNALLLAGKKKQNMVCTFQDILSGIGSEG
jgi:diguanylate cyclase (GGDEF)-like protein